jgi:hypothetical protein
MSIIKVLFFLMGVTVMTTALADDAVSPSLKLQWTDLSMNQQQQLHAGEIVSWPLADGELLGQRGAVLLSGSFAQISRKVQAVGQLHGWVEKVRTSERFLSGSEKLFSVHQLQLSGLTPVVVLLHGFSENKEKQTLINVWTLAPEGSLRGFESTLRTPVLRGRYEVSSLPGGSGVLAVFEVWLSPALQVPYPMKERVKKDLLNQWSTGMAKGLKDAFILSPSQLEKAAEIQRTLRR